MTDCQPVILKAGGHPTGTEVCIWEHIISENDLRSSIGPGQYDRHPCFNQVMISLGQFVNDNLLNPMRFGGIWPPTAWITTGDDPNAKIYNSPKYRMVSDALMDRKDKLAGCRKILNPYKEHKVNIGLMIWLARKALEAEPSPFGSNALDLIEEFLRTDEIKINDLHNRIWDGSVEDELVVTPVPVLRMIDALVKATGTVAPDSLPLRETLRIYFGWHTIPEAVMLPDSAWPGEDKFLDLLDDAAEMWEKLAAEEGALLDLDSPERYKREAWEQNWQVNGS